jgi:hypothetical protein
MSTVNFYLSNGGLRSVAGQVRSLPFRRMPEPLGDDALGTDSLACVADWCEAADVEFDRAQQAAIILAESFEGTCNTAEKLDADHCAQLGKIGSVL